MKLVSRTTLPVVEGDLPKTLARFVSMLRDHCAFDAETRCTLSLITTNQKLLALVARGLPADAGEFVNFPHLERKMTAGGFLAQSPAHAQRDHSSCYATLTDSLSRDQILALLSGFAGAIPVSGRGVRLMLMVNAAILSSASRPVRGRLSLMRPPKGKARYFADAVCEFEAESKSGPEAMQTLQELREALGVEWKKPAAVPDLSRADRPSAAEMTVVEQCIREAFVQAAADLDRAGATLAGGPHLYSPMGATYKRMQDITGGIHEKIDLMSEVKQFMRANFPDHPACRLGGSAPAFRKRLADHLDGLLIVERSGGGFGKCFSLQYHVDFPGTRFAGEAMDPLSRSRSLFSLFHKGGMGPVWAYAVAADLEQALADCGAVLRVALPALEARLAEYLSPVPEALPAGMPMRGRLSAREAYEEALWIAKAWSADARFVGVHSGGLHIVGHELARGVDLDGRLQSHGRWLVRFESKRLNSDLFVDVPHSGQIQWDSVVKMFPVLCALPSPHWLDSPAVMQTGIEAIKKLAPDDEWATWECGILEDRDSFAAVWTIHVSFCTTTRRPSFRDAYVYLNPADGSVVHSVSHER
jgi:hypothetical protein